MRVRKLGSRGRVLVLGCAGFVGLHLVERLLARPGVEVVGWSLGRGRPAELPSHPRLTLRQGAFDRPEARDLLEADILFADWVVDLATSCASDGGAWRTIHGSTRLESSMVRVGPCGPSSSMTPELLR